MTCESESDGKNTQQNHEVKPEPVYAWGGLADQITRPLLAEIEATTNGGIEIYDLCSAYPILRQIFIENHRDKCLQRAEQIVGSFIQSIAAPKRELPPQFSELDGTTQKTIRKTSQSRTALPRQLLTAAVYETLFNPPELTGEDEEKNTQLEQVLRTYTQTTRRIYTNQWELEDMKGKGRWQIIQEQNRYPKFPTFEECLQDYCGNIDLESFFSETTAFLATKIDIHELRTFRVTTIDQKSLDDIRELAISSEKNFPDYYRDTYFFERAGQGDDPHTNHIQADILTYNFGKNSASFITCFEGFPWYFDNLTPDQQEDFAHALSDALKPGGKMVFYPWSVENARSEHTDMLSNLIRLWSKAGLKTRIEKYQPTRISQRTEKLLQRSLILGKEVLIVGKPSENETEYIPVFSAI